MDKVYIQLFSEIAHAVELTAEQVLENNLKENDADGEHAAVVMRDSYAKLYDKIRDDNFVESMLDRADYAKLLVGAFIVTQNLEQKIETEKKALQGYKIDTLPKLDRIMNETKNDEEAKLLAKEIFNSNI